MKILSKQSPSDVNHQRGIDPKLFKKNNPKQVTSRYNKQMKILLFASVCTFAWVLQSFQKLAPVTNVDLKQYSGLWYEIARLPNSYETNCARNTAEYTLKPDGFLGILNRCTKANGYTRESKGIARIDNSPGNSILSTNFVPNWLHWTGLGWEDYWIIDLDQNYQFAVISEPNQDYLWIFSRQESIDKTTYDMITAKLRAQHFNLSHLIVSGTITLPNVLGFPTSI